MKEHSLLIIVTVLADSGILCWRHDHQIKNNIATSKEDFNPYDINSGNTPFASSDNYWDHTNDEKVQNYQDSVVFPDSEDYSPKHNFRPPLTSTPKPQRDQQCARTCNTNKKYEPVCGTDNITYHNLEQLQCAMRCGVDVQLRQLSQCPGRVETTPNPSPIVSLGQLQSCLSRCPTTPEYNPVCGTDNVTYYNQGKLTCAQICGVDVQVKRRLPCSNIPQTSLETTLTTSSAKPYERSNEFFSCIHSCPTTSEYNPVCGSNGKTYDNIGKLKCARYCGVDVTFVRQPPCSITSHTDTDIDDKFITTARTVADYTTSRDVIQDYDKKFKIDIRWTAS